MRTFLQDVAHDLYGKLDSDLSKTAIVFPNKRAGLFFNEYLADESEGPMWAPVYVSIKDLMQRLSPLQLGDRILLVAVLYNVYIEKTGSDETLDSFFPWGELLISDFDDVDKNLVDADRIFENLSDLKNEMNDLDFLDAEQIKALEQFFQNFSFEKHTELKQRFANSWNKLKDIYHAYQTKLTEMGIAYEGMLYRSIIDKIQSSDLTYDHYVFVGFNVLNKVEKQFFSIVQQYGKAMFYWDYDKYYMPSTAQHQYFEAGEFLQRNLTDFGNELDDTYFDHFNTQPKDIRFIAASTENAQARYMSQWAEKAVTDSAEKENAVVLCNESLLLPVLHSIPNKVNNVNVTMGFPLLQTPIYNFLTAVSDLQTDGYDSENGQFAYSNIRLVLNHPYTQQKSPHATELLHTLTVNNHPYSLPSELQATGDDFLNMVFVPQNGNVAICQYLMNLIQEIATLYKGKDNETDLYSQLYQESIYEAYTSINRLLSLIQQNQINISVHTLSKLLNNILHSSSIPFHGEPAIGMQIMGVLETRNLDFKNLLMLSLNEGQLPKSGSDMSFIPYNIRKAFGMTTIEHKNAVYAYYFYRLIQRAESITLLYNSTTSGLSKGEMSRFMLQLLMESKFDIKRLVLDSKQKAEQIDSFKVEKTADIMGKLNEHFDATLHKGRVLSPSALNHYMDCPLRFYFQYIAELKAPDEATMEINSPMFGTIFHKSAQNIYNTIKDTDKHVTAAAIDSFLKTPKLLKDCIDSAFRSEFFNLKPEDKAVYNGTYLINFRVIEMYLKQLLQFDRRFTPFDVLDEEHWVSQQLVIDTLQGRLPINIGGSIDRLDRIGDTLRIVDYKTGGEPKIIASVADLFRSDLDRASYVCQAFMYSLVMTHEMPGYKIKPTLLYIHKAANKEYSSDILIGESRQPKEPIEDFNIYAEEYRNELLNLINEIFNTDKPFTQAEDSSRCQYCDFARICKR